MVHSHRCRDYRHGHPHRPKTTVGGTDPMSDSSILKKIKALLTLADPTRGGTEAERDTAMRKAQELMFKHKIKEFELFQATHSGYDPEDTGNVTHFDWINQGKTKQWEGKLFHYLAQAIQCTAVVSKLAKHETRWTIVGVPDDLALVRALHDALCPWLRSQSSIARKAARPSKPNAFNRAFYDEASFVIYQRLRDNLQQMEDQLPKGTELVELVLYRGQQVQTYASNLFGPLGKSRSRGYGNTSGHIHGRIAGEKANLDFQSKLQS